MQYQGDTTGREAQVEQVAVNPSNGMPSNKIWRGHHASQHVARRVVRRTSRTGMTMIEVLIATAMTLMIMLALAQMFKMTSEGISAGRARLTGSDQLRSVTSLLRFDLQGLTVSTTTHPQSTKSPLGYFMYYDGPISEFTAMLFNYLPTGKEEEDKFSGGRWSDIDDVLMFTEIGRAHV